MIPVQVQTSTFFFERAMYRLASKFPEEGMERIKANLQAFRAWVAEPAFRAQTPELAVAHILNAVGPAVQLKAELLATLASVPHGLELFLQAMSEDLPDLVPEERPLELLKTANLLQRAQRVWARSIALDPDLSAIERSVGSEQIGTTLTSGFHADNLFTTCLMATDGLSPAPSPQVLHALCIAALDFARQYHQGVQTLVETGAPEINADDPLKPTTVADLRSLPPYDGPAATIEEMKAAIEAAFGDP